MAAAVTTGRSREQRFPPQRSAASDRPYTARELSPTPLPASVALSLPPPLVATSPASAQRRRPRPGPRQRGGAGAEHRGCPDGRVTRESQPALAGGPAELPRTVLSKRRRSGWRMRVVGLGNPGLRKSQSRASVFSSVKREEGRVGPAFQPWRLSSCESLDLKSLARVCVCVCVGWGHSFCNLRDKAY